MRILKLSISCFLIIILFSGISYAQNVRLYGAVREDCGDDVPADGSLYTIDPNTGQAQLVGGPFGFEGVTAMVFLNNGRLVATATDDVEGDLRSILIEINPLTGQGTLIGMIGNNHNPDECGRVPGLSYDRASNTLYGLGRLCDSNTIDRVLLEINPNTAQATIIGSGTGIGGAGNGLAIDDQGVIFSTPSPSGGALVTINPVTGVASQVAFLTPSKRVNSLDFHPVSGVLFGSHVNNNIEEEYELVTINTENGAVNVIGDLPPCIDGLAFTTPIMISPVPTLSEWTLIITAGILGIIGFLVIRRRTLRA